MPALSPSYSPNGASGLDGRTWQARLLTATRRDLTVHVGGNPSTVQRALIDRCAWITLHLAVLDRKAAKGVTLTVPEQTAYTSWSTTLARCLDRLGTQPAAPKAKTLEEHLAERASAAA
jgi:hypothetical protein